MHESVLLCFIVIFKIKYIYQFINNFKEIIKEEMKNSII
jgi:hypothetical protein